MPETIVRLVGRFWATLIAGGTTLGSEGAEAQQVNDTEFRFVNPAPACGFGEGARLCVDEGHNNQIVIGGRYDPFFSILAADGYRVERLASLEGLGSSSCDALIIANAQASENVGEASWAYPHPSAFSREEISRVALWVRRGGNLLLIADHAPFAGGSADMGYVLGVAMNDVWAYNTPRGMTPEVFRIADGTVQHHSITEGRNPTERIDSIATWVAHPFAAAEGTEPVLVFGPQATSYVMIGEMGQLLEEIPEDDWPRFRIGGFLLAAAKHWGEGRIVVLGDGSMCTAQLYGVRREPLGMNNPAGSQNAQFCLNSIRWLTRVLD